ncbi:MAG: hypothetical protein GYB35_17020, partial [Algicola sp.]|nr:hypothetical protein [Algicola sp.]
AKIPAHLSEKYEMLTQHQDLLVEQMKKHFIDLNKKAAAGFIRLDKIEPLIKCRIEEEIHSIIELSPETLEKHHQKKWTLLKVASEGVKVDESALNYILNSAFKGATHHGKDFLLSYSKSKKEQELNLPENRVN